jgi:hypothetical protein
MLNRVSNLFVLEILSQPFPKKLVGSHSGCIGYQKLGAAAAF